MNRSFLRTAAVVLFVGVVGAAALLIYGRTSNIAFADLIEPILTAKSATYKTVIQIEDKPPQIFTAMILGPNRVRQELPDGAVSIIDGNKGKMVTINPKQKLATVIEYTNQPNEKKSDDFFGKMREHFIETKQKPGEQREELGEAEIDGRKVIGFRLSSPGGVWTIWGDPKTGLPVSVECEMSFIPNAKVTMTDFVFDAELDEALFSVEPPAGYTVHNAQADASPAVETDLIETFRTYSDRTDGSFPDALNAQAMFALNKKLGLKKGVQPSQTQAKELMNLTMKVGRGIRFAILLPPEADAFYAGKGVSRDAADTPIFWYKPLGAATYRVVYADLSVTDAQKAPNVPHAQPVSANMAPENAPPNPSKKRAGGF